MRRRGTLGPFPKTRRWREWFSKGSDGANPSDASLIRLKTVFASMVDDQPTMKCVILWAGLPLVTREEDPAGAFARRFLLDVRGPSDLLAALDRWIPGEHAAKAATAATISEFAADADGLLPSTDWDVWREFDGPEFCNLAMRFFANLNREVFSLELPHLPADQIETMAREMALITRAFSARWFNACARLEIPSRNNIHWYLGHCLGKIDLELSREMSHWEEQPRKRKGPPEPALDL